MRFALFFIFLNIIFVNADVDNGAKYGESCEADAHCVRSDSLVCDTEAGICTCPFLTAMHFDPSTGRCEVLAGGKCGYTEAEYEAAIMGVKMFAGDNKTYFNCTSDSHCNSNDVCECDPAFFKDSEGKCTPKGKFGEICSSNEGCHDGVCSPESGTCECDATMSFHNATEGTCLRLAGAKCNKHLECVEFAMCMSWREQPLCECLHTYFVTENRTCERRRGPGGICTEDYECLRIRDLSCVPETQTCTCDEKVSNVEDGVCARKAGATCSPGYRCTVHSICGHNYSLEDGNELRCDCEDDFYRNVTTGTCIPQRGLGERCSEDDHCRWRDRLVCDTKKGVCVCKGRPYAYDSLKKKCVGMVRAHCQDDDQCLTGTYCKRWEKTCDCAEEIYRSDNRTCVVHYGGRCNHHWTQACRPEQGLVCIEGRCDCKYRSVQHLDGDLNMCVSQVGGPCRNGVIPCVKNAHCSKLGEIGRCECDKGFIAADGKCEVAFGYPCDENGEGSRCDSIASLRCVGGTCRCKELEVYDPVSQMCG